MPHECLTIRQAMDAAITKDASGEVETAWSDAGVMPGDPVWAGGTVFTDRREMETTAPQQAVWASVCSLGGKHGYTIIVRREGASTVMKALRKLGEEPLVIGVIEKGKGDCRVV